MIDPVADRKDRQQRMWDLKVLIVVFAISAVFLAWLYAAEAGPPEYDTRYCLEDDGGILYELHVAPTSDGMFVVGGHAHPPGCAVQFFTGAGVGHLGEYGYWDYADWGMRLMYAGKKCPGGDARLHADYVANNITGFFHPDEGRSQFIHLKLVTCPEE